MKNKHFRDIFYVVVFVLLLGGAVLSYFQIRWLIAAGDQVNHTNLVKLKIQEASSVIRDGESAQRGYLLTGDSVFINPYTNSAARASLLIDQIEQQTADNPVQRKNVKQLRTVFKRRFTRLEFVKDYFDGTGKVKSDELLTGKLEMDAVQNKLLIMQLEEDGLMKTRLAKRQRYASLSPGIVLLFTLLILTIIFFAFRTIRRERWKLRKINQSLENKNAELVSARNFSQLLVDSSVDLIMALDHDLNYVSINQRAEDFTGKKPHELIGNNLLDIFPKARNSVSHKSIIRALAGETVHIETHRGISDNQRYFDIFFIPLKDQNIITGALVISRDITTLVDSNEELKQKNLTLERANKELASFNYISSHDLQEPLRKINIFADRILEEAGDELSESTKKSFGKITEAAQRMRKLIIALLNYSLANNSDGIFVNTDLNVLAEEVTQHVIEEDSSKEIVMEIGRLPTLPVIPIQFQQLLTNLAGNSVKYSKATGPVFIRITAKEFSANSLQHPLALRDRSYVRISVADNGIGFEQGYADKIFGLFQRLHSKTEYSGTGIGLAICRKIVENHHGFISAEGKPDEGSVFNIFLPI